MALLLINTPTNMQILARSFLLGVIISVLIFKSKFVLQFNKKINTIYWIIGIVFSIANGAACYSIWAGSKKLATMLSIGSSFYPVFLGIIVFVLALISAPIVVTVISYYIEMGIEIIDEFRSTKTFEANRWYLRRATLFLSGIYILGISAIVRVNYGYRDDLARAARGYKGWDNYRRLLSNVLSSIVHMDNYLTDVSPLTQILSAVIMAISGVLLLVIIYERTHFSMLELLALSPLCLNPYFLECITYKYDSPYMALSVFGGIFPLLYRKRNIFTYISVSALGILIMCLTYQASSGIYPMLVALLTLRMWCRKDNYKKIAKFCGGSFIGYGAGILIFKSFIMTPTEEGKYVSNALPKISEFVPNLIENLIKYYECVLTDFKVWWLCIIIAVIIGFIITMIRSTKQNKILTGFVATITILLMGLLCFGMYPLLVKPLFLPRAMLGFGALLTFLSIGLMENMTKVSFVNISVVIMSWTFFVFAFTYGNALSVQKEYTEFRINLVMDDINDLEQYVNGEEVIVQLNGDIGLSPVIEAMPQNFQMLNRLMPKTFGEMWEAGLKFYYYYDSNFIKNSDDDIDIDLTTYNLPLLVDSRYHTIYGNDSYLLIELK
jgi:hypothetical protein